MPHKILTVLLIEDRPDHAALVQRWLTSNVEKEEFVLNWADSLEAGLRRLAHGGVNVVLLDLGLNDSGGSRTFEAVRTHPANVPIIVLSGSDNERLALQMIQHGAQDYIVKSTCTDELLKRALRYAVSRHHSQAEDDTPAAIPGRKRVVGVLGSCGGAGATTVASVVAADLAHMTGLSVLAADLDLHQGAMSFAFGAPVHRSLLDAAQNVERLDRELWDLIVAHRPGELDVLISPALMGAAEPAMPAVAQVFQRGKDFYDWMVLDLGTLNPCTVQAVQWCTDVLLVASLSIPSLHQTKRTLDVLDGLGVAPDQIRLIVNHRGEKCDLSKESLRNMLGVEVFATLPPAHEDLYQAYLQKRLAAVSSNFRQELTIVARRLAGQAEDKPQSAAPSTIAFVANRFRSNREIA